MKKKCFTCKEELPVSEFGVRSDKKHLDLNSLGRYTSSCMSCDNLNTKLRFFGIDRDQWEDLRHSAMDRCQICGVHESDVRNKKTKHYGLYIDHCHTTSKVRGLLCHSCNLVLGHSKDNISLLEKAISYLKT